MAVAQQRLGVVGEQGGEVRARRDLDAVLVLGEQIRPRGVEAGEVEEGQRLAVDAPAVRRAGDVAALEVPIGEVQGRGAQDGQVADQARRQVHPLLVGEQAGGEVDAAVEAQLLGPPVEQVEDLRLGPHGRKAEIEGARLQDDVVVGAGLAAQRTGGVRRQGQGRLGQSLAHRVERAIDPDVGIEIGAGGDALFRQQRLEAQRLDRGVELQRVVIGAHGREVRHDAGGVEGADARILEGDRAVGGDDHAADAGLDGAQALHQAGGLSGVVARDDGEDEVQGRSPGRQAAASSSSSFLTSMILEATPLSIRMTLLQ